MRWTERQRALLREMGITAWGRDAPAGAEVAAATPLPSPPPSSRSASSPAAAATATLERPAVAAPARPAGEARSLPPADWLVVGEAAASGEAAATESQLLDNLLRAIGVARDGRGREGRAGFLPLGESAAGSASEQDDALLQAALDAVSPRCILALGRAAARALLGSDEPLGSLRGAVHRRGGAIVVVTCSLAFLLRHADEKARVWAELCAAVRALDDVPA